MATLGLFMSDIEGSTRLAASLGSEFPRVLEEHFSLITNAVSREAGSVVSTEGDSVFAVFPSARQAVAAAVAAQRAVGDHQWGPEAQLLVRIGVHAGEAVPGPHGYTGAEVHRTSRIASAAWGGQILASEAARLLVADQSGEASFEDLGRYTVRDFPEPIHLYQVVCPGLRHDFPPPRVATTEIPTNLPAPLTRFVGRGREIADLEALLESERLVTLTGPGGTGKTRLSIEAARLLKDRFSDGVWFVALDAVRQPELVMPTIAQTLGVPELPGRAVIDGLADRLNEKQTLLVLDNFEQVVDAAPEIGRLLERTAPLRVVVSSRQPLSVAAERVYPVPPLDVPADAGETASAVGRSTAIELFVERARAVRPAFSLTDDNASAVASICRRLDGLPLAIELAAARLNLLSPQQIAARLEHRFSLLAGTRRDLPARQRSLRAAIDWSHELLSEPERALFRRFSVFVGGADLDAVQAVVDPDMELAPDPLDLISALVDRSLTVATDDGDAMRMAMLETIREYAAERLYEAEEAPDLQARHARHYCAIAEAASTPMADARRNALFARLDRDIGNFRAAIRWSLEGGDIDVGLRLASGLGEFWHIRNHLSEGVALLRELVDASADQGPTSLRARALCVAGGLLSWQTDVVATRTLSEEGLAMAEAVGDPVAAAVAKSGIAWSAFFGNPTEAVQLFEDAAAAARAIPDDWLLMESMNGHAWVHLRLGHLEQADAAARETIALGERIGAEYMTTFSLLVRGVVEAARGDRGAAARWYAVALSRSYEAGAHTGIAVALDFLASAALEAGEVQRGAVLAVAAEKLRHESRTGPSMSSLGLEDPLARARAMLEPSDYERAIAEGTELSTEAAVAKAQEVASG
jgi:predicted ATPase/class 3 adenylate cyclase